MDSCAVCGEAFERRSKGYKRYGTHELCHNETILSYIRRKGFLYGGTSSQKFVCADCYSAVKSSMTLFIGHKRKQVFSPVKTPILKKPCFDRGTQMTPQRNCNRLRRTWKGRACQMLRKNNLHALLKLMYSTSVGKKAILKFAKTITRNEAREYCSGERALSQHATLQDIEYFQWYDILDEVHDLMPCTYQVLSGVISQRKREEQYLNLGRNGRMGSSVPGLGVILAMLIHKRHPQKFAFLQEIMSLELFASGCKQKSAIKAKLIELGAYVDDELPDYIMVMVANKRSQQQMTDDLSLFLSTSTDKFTLWLHGLLKKLQSINTDQVQTKPKHKDKHKTEKKKHRPSTSEKTGKTEIVSTDSKKEELKKQKSESKDAEGKIAERITSTVTTGEEGTVVTEINISENTDEFNEENKSLGTVEPSKSGKPAAGKAKTEKSTKSSSKSQDKLKDKEVKKSSKKKPSSFVASVKRKYEEEEEDEEYDPLNPAVGNVASVIRGPNRKSSVPKAMQANRSLLMKAVNDAEKSVTTSKKTDVSPSESSLGMKSDHRPVDLRKRLKTAAGLQLISRTKRKGLEDMTYTVENDIKKSKKSTGDFTDIKYTVKNVQATKNSAQRKSKAPAVAPSRMAASALKGISKAKEAKSADTDDGDDDVDDEEQYGPPLPDTRLVHQAPRVQPDSNEDSNGYTESVSDNVTDPEIQKILEEAQDTDLDLNIDSPLSYQYVENKRIIKKEKKSPSPLDPRFIVTLDGVDPATFTDFQEEKPNIVQTVKPMARFPPSRPLSETVEQSKAPTDTELYSKITPPKIKPFNINLKESDDEEEESEDQTTPPPPPNTTPSASILERCRFWPACANGSSCQYIHPSIPCKTFPYCKFGEKCMYIHPNCKYDAKCSRMDCPFTHASKRTSVQPTVIHKIVQVPVQPFIPPRPALPAFPPQSNNCKFYPNCTNMNCPYTHPRPCRYGIGCMNKSSCTFFHPALPTKEKLTWTSTFKKTSPGSDSLPGKQVKPTT